MPVQSKGGVAADNASKTASDTAGSIKKAAQDAYQKVKDTVS